jgi:hypothetical protein
MEVGPIVPKFLHWQVPQRAVLGQSLQCQWDTEESESVSILIDGTHQHEGGAVGTLNFSVNKLGSIEIEMVARSQHAALTPQATIHVRQRLDIEAPPVIIEINQVEQWESPGAEAAFHWDIKGVVRLALQARGEIFDLPLSGSLYVPVGITDESFELIATGYDERVKHTTLYIHSVIPNIVNDSVDGLDLLFQPLSLMRGLSWTF